MAEIFKINVSRSTDLENSLNKKIKQPKKSMICTTLQKMGSDTVSDFFPDSMLQRLHHNGAKDCKKSPITRTGGTRPAA